MNSFIYSLGVDNGINKETKIEVNQNDHIVTGSFMKEKAAAEGKFNIMKIDYYMNYE